LENVGGQKNKSA